MSSKSELLQAWQFKTEVVTLPNGMTATLREFSGADRDAFEQSMVKIVGDKREADLTNMRSKLISACLIDTETGERMFTVEELAAAPATAIEPLFQVAQRLNGLGSAELDTAAKNSPADPNAASISV